MQKMPPINLLRRAGLEDAPALNALAHAAYAPWQPVIGCVPEPMAADWAEVTRTQEVWVLDARDGVGAEASLALKPAPDHLLIWSIAIALRRQRAGLGRTLLALAERRAAALGIRELRLYAHTGMARNIAIYGRTGYLETRTEDRGDRVVQHMAKLLPEPAGAPSTMPPGNAALLRPYADRDAAKVRDLFVRINRELAPVFMSEAFERCIALALRDEIGRIPDYYRPSPGSGFWVAEDAQGTLLGMFGLEPAAAEAAELRRMYVAPGARGRGLARAMLAEAERLCLTAGLRRLVLSTSELQLAALRLYRNAQYRLVGDEVAGEATIKTVGSGLRRYHFEKVLCAPAERRHRE